MSWPLAKLQQPRGRNDVAVVLLVVVALSARLCNCFATCKALLLADLFVKKVILSWPIHAAILFSHIRSVRQRLRRSAKPCKCPERPKPFEAVSAEETIQGRYDVCAKLRFLHPFDMIESNRRSSQAMNLRSHTSCH